LLRIHRRRRTYISEARMPGALAMTWKAAHTHAQALAPSVYCARGLRRNAANTNSSQSKALRENFFSICFRLLRLTRATLFTRCGCANIFASDLLQTPTIVSQNVQNK
jgi:hypothetical protein